MKELQYLNKFLLQYKGKLFVGIIITIAARIFSLFTPLLIGDSITATEKFLLSARQNEAVFQRELLVNILLIIGAALLAGILTFWMRQTIINVSRYIEFDLKNEIFWHYQKLTQRFYKNNRTGDLMNRISEDVSKVRMYAGPALMYGINTIALFVIVIGYMLSIAPMLTLYTLLPLPILSYAIYWLSKIIHKRSTLIQEVLSKMSSFAQESFSGISVIKSYNLQTLMGVRFGTLALNSYDKNMSLVKVQAWFFPLMILLIGFSNLIVIFIGGNQYIQGEIEIGMVAEFIIYVNMLTWPVAMVGWITSIVQQAEASQKRINVFLKETPEIRSGSLEPQSEGGEICFKNVTLTYPETNITAIKKLNFSIQSGQTLGVVGKVGSGKSSILDLIARLYDPTEGIITVDGMDIRTLSLEKLRSSIGYVPQSPFLFSETIASNILFGNPAADTNAVRDAAKKAAIDKNIEAFSEGYETLLGERGVTLSGGQIQRVSIARALIKDPQILLLDDCLSAVDTDTEEKILSHLESFRKQRTAIIVSHRISSVKNANQIIVLDEGVVIQQGTHHELIQE